MMKVLAPLLVLVLACGDEIVAPSQAPTVEAMPTNDSPPVEVHVSPVESAGAAMAERHPSEAVTAPTTPPPERSRFDVDELVFGPNPAAYDRTGRPPPPRVPRGPDEDYTADPYEFDYADVPGLEGVRAPTNHVTLFLHPGNARDVAVRLAESEGGEIVGQIPASRWYDLKLPTTTFAAVAAAVERLRAQPEVKIVGFAGEDEVARGREALAR